MGLFLAACTVPLISRLLLTSTATGSTLRPGHEALERLFAHPDHARRLGRLYLADTSDGSAPAAERAELELMLRRLRPASTAELRHALRARIHDDFAKGKIVAVDGWYLARTEAALCSLLVT